MARHFTRLYSSRLGPAPSSTPSVRSSSGLIDLLSPQPMHPCSLMQASTKMPTSLVVAAEERCWPPPLDGVSVARSKCSRAASPAAPLGR